ncbi:CRIB domain-containing protein RIC4-like protein [Tanacetum coccineum]
MGCISKSTTECKEQKPQPKQIVTRVQDSSGSKHKNSWGFVSQRRSKITRGIRRLILNTFQSFSRILTYKDIEDIDTEMELEIGYPTDVKHVTHIGYDGSMTTNPVKNWDNVETPEIHSFPTISVKDFEHAMSSQSETRQS